jgi:capsular polysaccharide export protein
MEPEGMGARSTFPKDPETIRAMAAGVEAPNMVNLYPHGFATEAFNEVSFHLLQAYGRPFYPFYNSDKVYWPAIDYLSWLGELMLDRPRKRAAAGLQSQVESGALSYNLIAMQIQADYQIRCSSPYAHLSDFLEEVFKSFAQAAPASRHLIVKLHPLDNGLERWFSQIPKLAREAGIESRVHVIRGGDLGAFLRHSNGVVLVNSTVGLHALRLGVPTYAAGDAVFDVEGLTHLGPLDSFWTDPQSVDLGFFAEFERAIKTIQIKGSFYNYEGRMAAIGGIRDRLRGS